MNRCMAEHAWSVRTGDKVTKKNRIAPCLQYDFFEFLYFAFTFLIRFACELSHKDSNLIKQNQNLLCYHYTMGQCSSCMNDRGKAMTMLLNCGCKVNVFL